MMEHIKNSIGYANRFPAYILFIGIFEVAFISGRLADISLVGFLVSLVLEVILLGKISNLITAKEEPHNINILKENWLNYFIIVIAISSPIFLLDQANNIFTFSVLNHLILKISLTVFIAAISFYVLPIAFIKKINVQALLVGIYYLFTNFKYSIPLLSIVIISALVKFSPLLFITQFQSMGIYGIIPIVLLSSVLYVYIAVVVFGAATLTLSANYVQIEKA